MGGVIGARILYIITEWDFFFHKHPWVKFLNIEIPSIVAIWNGGLVYWGGFVGGLVACVVYAKIKKIPMLYFLDIIANVIPLIQAFGRIGCLFAGCCYGKLMNSQNSFGLRFPPGSVAFDTLIDSGLNGKIKTYMIEHNHTWPLFPCQLIESISVFLIYLILTVVSNNKKFHGQILLNYILLYSVARILIEFFRGDIERGYLLNNTLSTSQFISLITIVVSIFFTVILRNNRSAKIN